MQTDEILDEKAEAQKLYDDAVKFKKTASSSINMLFDKVDSLIPPDKLEQTKDLLGRMINARVAGDETTAKSLENDLKNLIEQE